MRVFSIFLGLLIPMIVNGSNIQITQVEYVQSDGPEYKRGVNVTISWKNSWNTDKNHDAAWVFFKVINKNKGYQHLYLMPNTAHLDWKATSNIPDAEAKISSDGTGMMVYPTNTYRGDVTYRFFVELDTSRISERYINYLDNRTIEGYGIEMVYIPKGAFTLGDPDTTALNYGAFFQSDDVGEFDGLYTVTKENAPIEIGKGKDKLFYRGPEPEYQGDQQGPIPAAFPKGVGSFYLMKYEVNQGIYAAFLNSLSSEASSVRFTGGTPDYERLGGTIKLENSHFVAALPQQRMVFWHWNDMMAFTDWAALRPYTELEFTKACRGLIKPLAHEMPWNTSNSAKVIRRINPKTHRMELPDGYNEGQINDENREFFGASYYWVMDLGGSMWEKVVTLGDSVGRAFEGQHGDGRIDYYGRANVEGWPHGYGESYGYGYRGGGYYGKAHIAEFTPYSPIAYRLYGAWSGGARNAAYGYRAARTLE
ncbi:MAG: SUMF1/EgtB/PvdO family nonheme iron enzyme [Bacteroidota bacterium]